MKKQKAIEELEELAEIAKSREEGSDEYFALKNAIEIVTQIDDKLTYKQTSTILDFLENYAVRDSENIYSNGIVFVPLFRVEQALNSYKDGECNLYVG